jgi:hypothetical protein
VPCLVVLSRHSPGRTEKITKDFRPRFEPGTSQIKMKTLPLEPPCSVGACSVEWFAINLAESSRSIAKVSIV